jgi:hypothetical protein
MHQFKVKRLQGALSPVLGALACQFLVIAPLGYRPRADSLQYYLWRWDIRVSFRDEKTIMGVGQAQVRMSESIRGVPATAVATDGLPLAVVTRAFSNQEDPRLFSPPRWHTKTPPRPFASALLDH